MSGYSIGQFKQIFFPDSRPNVVVRRYATKNVDDAVEYLREISPSVLGISLHFSSQGSIKAIAFATPTQVVWVSTEKLAPTSGLGTLLRDASVRLASFDMAQVALLIYKDLGFHVRGVDMSTLIAPSTRAPFSPSTFAQKMGLALPSHKLDVLWDSNEEQDICCSAFLTAKLAQVYDSTIEWTPKVKTEILEKKQLLCLADIVTERRQLKAAEPVRKQNDFATVQFTKDGVLLQNSRYKTRVRRGEKTMVEMEMEDGSTIHAKAVAMKGRQTTLHMSGFGAPGAVSKVVVRGREDLTCAEHAFNEFILLVLTGQASMDASEFICMLWFPELLNPNVSSSVQSRPDLSWANLNDSQRAAANAVLSPEVPFCLVHGPPGTGKTTVIAAAAKTWDSLGQPAWIVAQSNVAVKNIAEALVKRGVNFKLIVSKEFHFEWHEHIYERVDDVLIRSDDLGEDGYRMIGESAIILCTLSMLSNPVLQEKGIYDQVPAERLIIDEASQIGLSEYMHVFHQFRDDLVKVCFFGDPCQLPPYGQESVPSLKSVFQVKHLRKPLIQYLLDTQYRMPSPLGDFISKEMYNRKLRSQHEIKGPSCVRFVDVYKGEEEKSGTSWVNQEEARTIVHLVNNYYRLKDYAIITPYDAQRNIIEKMLNMETPKVYNVDSFQGLPSPCISAPFTDSHFYKVMRPITLLSPSLAQPVLASCIPGRGSM
ncbi:P-loop containing nucleoside triphosphate hydrolase protein [Heliocybe sulcata]|uniref:P-loop containing nucleoside triphosphate hydrolase protein n=1 Tax=Heliocybe sulcata TaxID=5364 RepID=A0A5C3MT84_9AGAM|nr:P-loop containing nucleoside triphosphate hydrolase protein [Heliocybe sulcata]